MAGFDVNKRDGADLTALHWAIIEKHRNLIELLLKKGAFLDANTKYHGTPLHTAVSGSDFDILNMIVDAGANLEIEDASGHTALLMANSREKMNT